ncbi:hypothetical protein BDV93DRAFT_560174 [Ceratobasidium sp. AG-I]|nr:hypothetical protein BDV93DRAFT_560174 [Ceratobasidium sp. AG-I]
MDQEGGYDPMVDAGTRCNLHALQLTIPILLPRLPKQDGRLIRALTFLLLATFLKKMSDFDDMSPTELWDRLLWDFLGDIVAGAVLRVVLVEKATELRFDCLQPPRIKEPLVVELGLRLTPAMQLQQFIEERIVRLSKHDIDHTPIIKHIPVPAMPPPLKSQQQMKDALEEIWGTANRGPRFRGT